VGNVQLNELVGPMCNSVKSRVDGSNTRRLGLREVGTRKYLQKILVDTSLELVTLAQLNLPYNGMELEAHIVAGDV
jgi:hypothetical protein